MAGVIAATILMVAYLGWYLCRHGVPFSISRTVFKLPHEVIFTLLMYAVAFLTIAPMIDACSENTKALAFLTMASIGFVGASPLGRNCDERVHMGAAILFGVCSQLMIALNMPVLLWGWLPVSLYIFLIDRLEHWLFLAEVACITEMLIFCVTSNA